MLHDFWVSLGSRSLVIELAAAVAVFRQSLSTWQRRCLQAVPAGLADHPKRPKASPWQSTYWGNIQTVPQPPPAGATPYPAPPSGY